jgi:hypothetical protein
MSLPVRLKSNTSALAVMRCGRLDLGKTMKSFCRAQRMSTCAVVGLQD